MKIVVGDYEVEITAKNKTASDEHDTEYFLNLVSIWASEAAQFNKKLFRDKDNALAVAYERASHEIFTQLLETGFYDDTGLYPDRGETDEK